MPETNAPDLRVVGGREGQPEDLVGEYLATRPGARIGARSRKVRRDSYPESPNLYSSF